jgi:hypothetical protein
LLSTAEAWCADRGLAPNDIIDARLAEDMLPFAYQVKSTAVHSLGAIEGVRKGVFSPDMTPRFHEQAAHETVRITGWPSSGQPSAGWRCRIAQHDGRFESENISLAFLNPPTRGITLWIT